jgi:ubiquinone/menaquinone biosynthesis C-methylase UbiE
METIRIPFQGVFNIIRFNWHFYLISIAFIILLFISANTWLISLKLLINAFCLLVISISFSSLLVSMYVYDFSSLYGLSWLNSISLNDKGNFINIHAGFDETSILLKNKYPDIKLEILDFYDQSKHTEISIKRARRAYPAFPQTKSVKTTSLPLQSDSIDSIFVILSAHEIRNQEERVEFFRELNRVLKIQGKIIVVEHLRNLPNFLAYNIGFLHFLSESSWHATFNSTELKISQTINITPFVTSFILMKNGTSS